MRYHEHRYTTERLHYKLRFLQFSELDTRTIHRYTRMHNTHVRKEMIFEWDENKNLSNISKHGISFETAKRIFEAPILSVVDNRSNYGEVRKISIGLIDGILIVVVIHTERNKSTRLISARKANKAERARYEKALRQKT